MRWAPMVMFASLLAGCGGYDEATFIPEKTDRFCDLYLECADEALLTFDGQDKDRCVSTFGPIFQNEQQQCKMVKRFAKQCVADLRDATCPSENATTEELLEAIPGSCGLAQKKCLGGVQSPDINTDDTGS